MPTLSSSIYTLRRKFRMAGSFLTTYGTVALWMSLSGCVVMHNKYLLSVHKFHYPCVMTMMHMGYSFLLAAFIAKGLKLVDIPVLTPEQFFANIFPVAVLYAVMLTCSNYSYIYLSVAFIQMLKASLPVLVFITSILFGLMKFDFKLLGAILTICTGIYFVTHGEINLNMTGFILQVAALCVEANRLALIEVLLKKRGINLNPLSTLFYVAPATFLCLGVMVFLFESQSIVAVQEMIVASPSTFLLNCSLAFLLNLAVFLIIGKTSALTMNIAGIAKDVIVIGVSSVVFDQPLYGRSLFGFAIAVVGVALYNYRKYIIGKEAAAAKELEDADPEKGTS